LKIKIVPLPFTYNGKVITKKIKEFQKWKSNRQFFKLRWLSWYDNKNNLLINIINYLIYDYILKSFKKYFRKYYIDFNFFIELQIGIPYQIFNFNIYAKFLFKVLWNFFLLIIINLNYYFLTKNIIIKKLFKNYYKKNKKSYHKEKNIICIVFNVNNFQIYLKINKPFINKIILFLL